MRYRWKQLAAILVLLCLSSCLFPAFADTGRRTIRVGYMDYDGFIMEDGSGGFEGYGVDYLNKIAQYTGWEYEYIFCPWPEQMERLENGGLDLVCAAQYTQERADVYGYPDYSSGQEAAMVYSRLDDNDIYYEDYPAMDGRRIAMIHGSFQNQKVAQMEEAHGIDLKEVYYESAGEVIDALLSREADLALLGGLALQNDLKVVVQFRAEPFYFITNKADKDLLGQLNYALDQIHSLSPYFEFELYEKYYESGAGPLTPLLTREECAFIKECPPIRIGCVDGYMPLCRRNEKTGNAEGILPELLQAISQKSGLTFSIVLLEDSEDIGEMISGGGIDLLAGVVYKAGLADGILVSEPLLDETLVLMANFERLEGMGNALKIALPNHLRYLENKLPSYFPQCRIQYYDTAEACMDSLVFGDNDITLQNNYVANYYLQRKIYQSLTASSYLKFDDPLALVGRPGLDRRVMSVINKSIPCVAQDERNAILMKYSIANPYQDSPGDLFWHYRYVIGIFVVLLAILVLASSLLRVRRTKMMLTRKEADTYRKISERDILTDVYSRHMFYRKAKDLLDQNPETLYQLIYLNVENFKLVNDLFGTEEGDRLLIYIAGWSKQYAHDHSGIAGRLDSDHFILCVPFQAEQGERVVRLLQSELDKHAMDMDITVNCGVYDVVDRTQKVQLMCDRAHLAANDGKGNVMRPATYYSSAHRDRLMQTQTVLNEMRPALMNGQFQIYLQPQISMADEKLIGAEALVRWIHPERGVIPPSQFIPVFEKNGFISRLDLYIFEEVCKLQKRWREEGRNPIPVSVNLSRVNFYSRTLREQLLRILNAYEVKPELVELELTESAYAVDDHEIYSRLCQLQSDGFHILMDDFGSGYSSLNMLKDAPVDILKLDLRFLYKTDPYQRSWQILKSILSMTEALGIPVIAEGVETAAQVEILSKTGCYAAQGYYYSRPVETAQFEEKYLTN